MCVCMCHIIYSICGKAKAQNNLVYMNYNNVGISKNADMQISKRTAFHSVRDLNRMQYIWLFHKLKSTIYSKLCFFLILSVCLGVAMKIQIYKHQKNIIYLQCAFTYSTENLVYMKIHLAKLHKNVVSHKFVCFKYGFFENTDSQTSLEYCHSIVCTYTGSFKLDWHENVDS